MIARKLSAQVSDYRRKNEGESISERVVQQKSYVAMQVLCWLLHAYGVFLRDSAGSVIDCKALQYCSYVQAVTYLPRY